MFFILKVYRQEEKDEKGGQITYLPNIQVRWGNPITASTQEDELRDQVTKIRI